MSKIVELRDVAYVIDRTHLTPTYGENGIPLVSPANFTTFGIDLSDCKKISERDYREELKRVRPDQGDILFSRIGTIGEVRWVPNERFVPLHSLVLVQPDKNKVEPEYLYYCLKSDSVMAQAKKGVQSISVPDLGIKLIKKFRIPLPPKPLQARMGSVLRKADNLRQKRDLANQLTNKIIQSVFLKMFGDPISNTKGFPKRRLGDMATLTMGGTPDTKELEYYEGGTINWMKSGDIKDDFITSVPNKITRLGLENSNAKLYKKGDVVIALNGQGKTRATTGILDVETASNQSVASISLREELLSEYFHFNLKIRYDQLRAITGDKQRSGLNLTILRDLDIVVPPRALQHEFAKSVARARSLRTNQNESTCEITKLFHSLMHKAFSGEFRSVS